MAAGLVLAAWIMVAADGPELRAIIPAAHACSDLRATADGRPLSLVQRADADGDFPVRVCAAPTPGNAAAIEVEGTRLRGVEIRPQRIVVIGDTGCRLKGQAVQACNDSGAWPFAAIAAAAARENPDLIIHLGDYQYRESPCPQGDARCQGSPWGDNWDSWREDFFKPVGALLTAAPWVMMRGNHEDCHRAGHGWTLMLAPAPVQGGCLVAHAPYQIDLGGFSLYVADDSDADDAKANDGAVLRLRKDLAAIPADQPVWLLTHHPWRGVIKTQAGVAIGGNATLLTAWDKPLSASVQLLLSGHIHVWQVENFGQGYPPQLIAGNGGDDLDTGIPPDLAAMVSGGLAIRDGHSKAAFGYAVLERQKSGWVMVAHKPDGTILDQCRFGQGQIACVR